MSRDAPTGAIALKFGMLGDIAVISDIVVFVLKRDVKLQPTNRHIADVVRAKFYVNRFRNFGVMTPPILPFSIGLAGRPYNNVSTTVMQIREKYIILESLTKGSAVTLAILFFCDREH